jgi:DNA topoisomerase-1
MEDQNLGTKSTRPAIIQKLKNRNYIKQEKQIEPTKIAISVCSVLNKHADLIAKPKLTADIEENMEQVATGNKTKEAVVDDSRKMLHEIIKILLKEKDDIAKELRGGIQESNYMGKCNKCGKNLIIRHGKTGKQFVACTGYPACRNTFPLPQNKNVTPIENVFCEVCKSPMIRVVGKRGKPYEMCLNHKCSTKEDFLKKMKENEAENTDNSEKPKTTKYYKKTYKPRKKYVSKKKKI